jgi:hypothetical protein
LAAHSATDCGYIAALTCPENRTEVEGFQEISPIKMERIEE